MKVFVKGLNSCINRKRDITRYREFAKRSGHTVVDHADDSDVVLLWTCAFRQDRHDHSIEQIKDLTQAGKEVVVCGCLPDINQASLDAVFKGHVIRWKDERKGLVEYFGGRTEDLDELDLVLGEKPLDHEPEEFKRQNPDLKVVYTDNFVKIFVSEGCSYKCTYCAERLAFPAYRSFPIEYLVAETRRRISNSENERIVLWADSLGDYGRDIGSSLPELVRRLMKEFPNIRIGLEHLHPANFIEYFPELVELVSSGVVWLLDLPIQSAADRVLKLMGRQYTKSDIERIFSTLNEIGFRELETHAIVGFPGETEDEFQETVDFLVRHKPKYILLSGYMEAPSASARNLSGQIASNEIRRRVISASEHISKAGIICNYDNSELSQERFQKDFLDLSAY